MAVSLTYENLDVPGSAIRLRRQIVDGIVRNEGVKPKKPGSGSSPGIEGDLCDDISIAENDPQCSIFRSRKKTKSGTQIGGGVGRGPVHEYQRQQHKSHDRTKKILKGLAIAGLTKLGMAVKRRMMDKHRTGGRVPSFMDSNGLNGGGHICSNEQIPRKKFTCPVETFNADETYCCGPPGRQWCCNEREYHQVQSAAKAVGGRRRSKGGMSIFKLLILIILLPVGFAVILIACACSAMCGLRDMLCGILSGKSYNRIPMFSLLNHA
ncbi:hypothetical protein ACOME3_008476 [Neoechinorhynchus agilis]